ncbi:MAG: hypothetical protein Q4F41_16145 [Eubacteriales bacterium]|nr:hypothetical protein [Eubacteriales bacterium]
MNVNLIIPGIYYNNNVVSDILNNLSIDNMVSMYISDIYPTLNTYAAESQRFLYPDHAGNQQIQYFWLTFKKEEFPLSVAQAFSGDFTGCLQKLSPLRYSVHSVGEYFCTRVSISTASCYPWYEMLAQGTWYSYLLDNFEDVSEGY